VDRSLDTLVRDAMERYRVPGVAIGMIRADDIEVTAFLRVGGRVYRRTRS